MADKVGEKGVLVCGLISMSISLNMNECLEQLMNRPDAPNLYWALSGFPNRQGVLSASIDGESQWWVNAIPNLAQAWRGEDISAQQWHAMLDYLHSTVGDSHPNIADVVKATSPELMRQAQEQYAQSHHITPEQAAGVDPIIIVGTFYLSQLQIARDNAFKLRGLAVPTRIAMSKKAHDDFEKLMRQQPANPFLQTLSDFHGIYVRFARIDRLLAALTTVEAIRSYAAANNGQLPAQLSDITDTPVPLNPATGESFEYRVENGTPRRCPIQSRKGISPTRSESTNDGVKVPFGRYVIGMQKERFDAENGEDNDGWLRCGDCSHSRDDPCIGAVHGFARNNRDHRAPASGWQRRLRRCDQPASERRRHAGEQRVYFVAEGDRSGCGFPQSTRGGR